MHRSILRLVEIPFRLHEWAVQRHRLMSFDDRMLKDIGISRADAMRETDRPFWR